MKRTVKECLYNGCEKTAIKRGYCDAHYHKAIREKVITPTPRKNGNGVSKHPLYKCWASMRSRCSNKNDKENYALYGGRGIKVCDRWNGKNGFLNFVEDMGPRPEGCSLDRIDVNGDYCPENCRWATQKEQNYNRRNNYRFRIMGVEYNTEEAAKILGLHPETLRLRKRKGLTDEEVVSGNRINHQKKKVVCVETGEEFDSIAEAARYAGVAYVNISSCCNGEQSNGKRRLTAAGKHWCFSENWPEVKEELDSLLKEY